MIKLDKTNEKQLLNSENSKINTIYFAVSEFKYLQEIFIKYSISFFEFIVFFTTLKRNGETNNYVYRIPLIVDLTIFFNYYGFFWVELKRSKQTITINWFICIVCVFYSYYYELTVYKNLLFFILFRISMEMKL